MRYCLTLGPLGLIILLSGCASERQFAYDTWPFGNPNAPASQSETAQRALGKQVAVTPIPPQAGNVWPGPVQPMPTLSDVEANSNIALGQGYTPSLPSPYPPGQEPPADPDASYTTQPGGTAVVVPAVPGDAR